MSTSSLSYSCVHTAMNDAPSSKSSCERKLLNVVISVRERISIPFQIEFAFPFPSSLLQQPFRLLKRRISKFRSSPQQSLFSLSLRVKRAVQNDGQPNLFTCNNFEECFTYIHSQMHNKIKQQGTFVKSNFIF